MYNTPTNHDLAQVQISLDNNVKCSGHFQFLFINRLKSALDRRVYLWSDLDLRFVSFYKSNDIAEKIDVKWLQEHCTKPCSAKSRNNGNQYSIHLHLCMMHRLIFHETIIVKGIVHFEIKIWYLSAYPKGIQDVGVFFSSVDPILMFLGQTVLVCQSYNGRYRSLSLWEGKRTCTEKSKLNNSPS